MNDETAQPAPKSDEPPPLSGIVLVDKPADRRITSMTVVRSVRRRLIEGGVAKFGPAGGTSRHLKVGHAGTLDPLASGLLIILVGRATRLCDRLMAGGKSYSATIDLSMWSETDDLEVMPTPNPTIPEPSLAEVLQILPQFIGDIQQRPPAHSAIWIEGERAYDLARAGIAPEMAARTIRIDGIELVSFVHPRLTVEVRCGKGTYIRSLARDLGTALTGHPGCLVSLRRTRVEPYSVEQATPLDNLPIAMTRADLMPAPTT